MENNNVKKIDGKIYIELETIVSIAETILTQYKNNPYLSDGIKQGARLAINGVLVEIRCIDYA